MRLAGDKPKQKVEQLASLLPIGKRVHVRLGKHQDTTMLLEVRLSTQKEIKDSGGNLPDKVAGENGKETTPAICSMVFENFILDVVLDAIDYEMKIGGTVLHFKWGDIVIKEV